MAYPVSENSTPCCSTNVLITFDENENDHVKLNYRISDDLFYLATIIKQTSIFVQYN